MARRVRISHPARPDPEVAADEQAALTTVAQQKIIRTVHWARATAAVFAIALGATLSVAHPTSAGSPLVSAAQAPAGCAAPKAVLRRGRIRVFLRGDTVRTYYLCSDRLRTPRAYHKRKVDPAEDEPFDFSVRGRRLLYTDFHVATQVELLAWVDLVTAHYREIRIPRGHEYDEIRALGPDGAIAFVTTDAADGQRIWYAAASATSLARPRIVARATDGDIVPESLRISGGRVRWKTPYGPPRSASLSGPARAVPAASRRCDSQERVYRKGAVRIFMRTVGNIERFYLCSNRLRKPRLFLEKNPWSHPPIFGFRRFGQRLMFWIDWGGESGSYGLGWVDLRNGRAMDVEVAGNLEVDEAAVGGDGAIVVRAGMQLHYARPGRRTLHALKPLATITNGEPVKGSLAIKGANVTWRTAAGAVGSVPVPAA